MGYTHETLFIKCCCESAYLSSSVKPVHCIVVITISPRGRGPTTHPCRVGHGSPPSIYKSCYFLIQISASGAILDAFRPRFFRRLPGIPKSGTCSGPRGRPGPVPDAPGIAIAAMCGSCATGPQKRHLRPFYVSLYISGMNGRSRAARGAQAWALGASACGHRHGRRQLLASPQREPHLDVGRWLQLPMARILKGKGVHSEIGGGGVESLEHADRFAKDSGYSFGDARRPKHILISTFFHEPRPLCGRIPSSVRRLGDQGSGIWWLELHCGGCWGLASCQSQQSAAAQSGRFRLLYARSL